MGSMFSTYASLQGPALVIQGCQGRMGGSTIALLLQTDFSFRMDKISEVLCKSGLRRCFWFDVAKLTGHGDVAR